MTSEPGATPLPTPGSADDSKLLKASETLPDAPVGPVILPISKRKDELIQLACHHPLIVVSGETGSGKTTKIPQYLFDAPEFRAICQGWDTHRRRQGTSGEWRGPRIVVVQPHRIAAIAMAKRVAAERRVELGEEVGYTVRWDSMTNPETTSIRYVTDGILVKELTDGSRFRKFDVVIIDEAHERSLHIDVLLALIKRELVTTYADRRRFPRPADIPVRFVITSASLDIERFSKFFNGCPTLTVPGKLYPVTIRHVPVKVVSGDSDGEDEVGGISVRQEEQRPGEYNPGLARRKRQEASQPWLSPDAAVTAEITISLRIHVETPVESGHILCFLAGAAECEQAVKGMHQALQQAVERQEADTGRATTIPSALVIPLYGALDARQQANVFIETPLDCRKIVFATNVAETSLTIPGVGHIVDSGVVKQTYYHPRSGMVALNRVPISKAQAKQRTGRAGRTKRGTCWRLYAEEVYEQMDEYTTPEILRTDPAQAVLQLLVMNVRNILSLEFLDTPSQLSIGLALRELAMLQAVRADTLDVTSIGRAIAITPLDPMYGRCFVAALEYDVVPEVATILALLSSEQVFTTPHLHSDDAEDAESPNEQLRLFDVYRVKHEQYRDPDSDHMTLLNIFVQWRKRRGTNAVTKKDELYSWCLDNYFSMRALTTAEKIQQQLIDLMPEIEELIGQPTQEFLGATAKMKKKERVLRALAQGLFINAAKVHITKSSIRGHVARGWTSAREGILLRPAPHSALSEFIESENPALRLPPRRKNPPAWIIYDQLMSIGNAPGMQQCIGTIRIGSGVPYEWISPLMTRIYRTSLDTLFEVIDSSRAGYSRRGTKRAADHIEAFNAEILSRGSAAGAVQLEPESTRSERERKAAEAKQRLLARKAARKA